MDVNKVHGYINQIEGLLSELKTEVATNPTLNVVVNGPARVRIGPQTVEYAGPPKPVIEHLPDLIGSIDIGDWPEAVQADLICDTDSVEEKVSRADALLDMSIESSLEDARFLDYGCGEGYMASAALDRRVALSVGYDPFVHDSDFPTTHNSRLRYTNNGMTLDPAGYDVILLYDVLDHADDPMLVMHKVSKLLAPGGTVYVSCHPWTARHGGHLYREFNKAYAHLWFEYDELISRGIEVETGFHVLEPIKTYRQWFNLSGFKIRSEEVREEPMEKYFRNHPEVWQRLTRHFDRQRGRGMTDDEIQKIMEIEFISYVLQIDYF